MPDYKQMYLHLFRATERAVNDLIAAQQACEELYCTAAEPRIILLPGEDEQANETDALGG